MNAKAVKPSPPSVTDATATSIAAPAAIAVTKEKKLSQRAQNAAEQWKSEPELQKALAGLSRNIVTARQSKGLKLTHLAKVAGLPLSTVFAAESGLHNLSLVTLLKIATALNVDAGSLLPTRDGLQSASSATAVSKIVEGCLETVLLDQRAAASRIEQTLSYIISLQSTAKPKP